MLGEQAVAFQERTTSDKQVPFIRLVASVKNGTRSRICSGITHPLASGDHNPRLARDPTHYKRPLQPLPRGTMIPLLAWHRQRHPSNATRIKMRTAHSVSRSEFTTLPPSAQFATHKLTQHFTSQFVLPILKLGFIQSRHPEKQGVSGAT